MKGLWPGRSQLHDGTVAADSTVLAAAPCIEKQSAMPTHAAPLVTVAILKPPRTARSSSSVRDEMY
jgi:hypothetical protein